MTPERVTQAALDYSRGLDGSKLAAKYDMSRAGMDEALKRHGVQFRPVGGKRIYTLNESFFDSIDTEEKAYILGFLYGDGYVTPLNTNIRITGLLSDSQILDDMRIAMGSNRPLMHQSRGMGQYAIMAVSSLRMRSRLYQLGVIPNKTKTLRFPSEHMDPSLYRHFVRGLFDSDGCVTTSLDKRTRKPRWVTVWSIFSTREMLTFIRAWMLEHGVAMNELTHDQRTYSNSAILATSRAVNLRSLWHLLYDSATICLRRKQDKLSSALEYHTSRGAFTVRPP